jgi:hypothetical protein
MTMTNLRLRIKHPSGAEFEAEGPAELILSEKSQFLSALETSRAVYQAQQQPQQAAAIPGENEWQRIAESGPEGLKLRSKHPEIKADTAALLLMAAERAVNASPAISAIRLSRALKRSGYVPERLDRLLNKAYKEGLVMASGTKRNRTYEATEKGLETAWLAARKLMKLLQ